MVMKIKVDLELCQGHSVCLGECPEVFNVVDSKEGYPQVVILQESPGEELRARVEAAAQYCPNHVISVEEE